MLRKIRIVAATICFTLITLLFLDFTGTLHLWFGWLAKIQFLPAVLALNVGVVRTNRIQSVRSALSMGKQFTRLLCRAYRQLCVLFHRRVAEKHTHFYHCPRHIRLVTYISMEKRAHLLQHDLPGGYCSGAIVPILSFPPRYRHDKM